MSEKAEHLYYNSNESPYQPYKSFEIRHFLLSFACYLYHFYLSITQSESDVYITYFQKFLSKSFDHFSLELRFAKE